MAKLNKEESVALALQNKANGIPYSETAKELGITTQTLRNYKRDVGSDIDNLCEQHGVDINSITGGWVKGDNFSLRFKNNEPNTVDILDKVEKRLGKTSKVRLEESIKGEVIGILGLSDIHIGKPDSPIGKYFNSAKNIIDKMLVDNVSSIIFVVGNDALNVDNVNLTTTKGTHQEMEVEIDVAIDQLTSLYESIIEYIQSFNDIKLILVYSPANHDNILSFAVVHGLCRRYDVDSVLNLESRNYVQYGNNLLGFTHGDKTKDNDLPSLMSVEKPKEWGNTVHRYFFRGHKHHKERKDFRGCTVIGMRSLSSSDKWHRDSGFIGSPRATEGFCISKKKGMVAEYIEII